VAVWLADVLDYESALLAVNQIASRINERQSVRMALGFLKTSDRGDTEEVAVRETFENLERGIHLEPPVTGRFIPGADSLDSANRKNTEPLPIWSNS
jgi:hypothetical protein